MTLVSVGGHGQYQREGAYAEELQITLPPGNYLAVAIRSGDAGAEKKQAQASVTAAERAEIVIQ